MSIRQQRAQQIARKRKLRYGKAKLHKFLAYASVSFAIGFLIWFFIDITGRAIPAFQQASIYTSIAYDKDVIGMSDDDRIFYEYSNMATNREHRLLVSQPYLRSLIDVTIQQPELAGTTFTDWVRADADVDKYLKYCHELPTVQEQFECTTIEDFSNFETMLAMLEAGQIELQFNHEFFSHGSYTEAEYAGFVAAMFGSVMVLLVTMFLSVPIGMATAIYLEEFASDNWFTRMVEVNINNLAAVPSIIFGLLGLAIFQITLQIDRGSAVIGGFTLGLMTLPVIVIATRAALRSIPEHIRIGAYGLGCTRWRVVRDHVLPLALPGILTGSIIGLAQAMGETAPLIMIGLIANVTEISPGPLQQTTVMPAQIFEWFGRSDNSFKELAALAILVLLSILLTMNAIAVFFRRRFERRW